MHNLVLLDVDKTIIDVDYQLNVPEEVFCSAIRAAQDAGVVIGINSDTPFGTLQEYAKRFGCDGPILAERGAVLAMSSGVEPEVIVPDAEQFSLLGQLLSSQLSHHQRRHLINLGDVRRLAQWERGLPQDAPDGTVAVLLNPLRLGSFSFWVRVQREQRWVKDPDALAGVVAQLGEVGRSIGPVWEDRDLDSNAEYGICIVHHRASNKQHGVVVLRDRMPEVPLTMIGDSMSDDLALDGAEQWAVANASDEYKQRCSRVATLPLTAGVIELLSSLLP